LSLGVLTEWSSQDCGTEFGTVTKKQKCPKCGAPDIYVGANSVECGYDPTCENWSAKQQEAVERYLSARFPSAVDINDTDPGVDISDLDWDEPDALPDTIRLWPV
jgi:hypothetical protein